MSKATKKEQPFSIDQFKPTPWDSAEDKLKFVRSFVRFVESGFEERLFTKTLYDKLYQLPGYIAHYHRDGFFAYYFTSTKDQLDFISTFVRRDTNGLPKYSWSDVDQLLQQWLRTNRTEAYLRSAIKNETEQKERAELKRLKAKYELQGENQ